MIMFRIRVGTVERMLEVKVPSAADIGRDPSGSARAIKHEKSP